MGIYVIQLIILRPFAFLLKDLMPTPKLIIVSLVTALIPIWLMSSKLSLCG